MRTRRLASISAFSVLIVSLRAVSALTCEVSLPIWAPIRSSATCIATIPSSAVATIAIQARPRTRRSSHGWSISAMIRPDCAAGRACSAAARGWRPGPETRRGVGGRRSGAASAWRALAAAVAGGVTPALPACARRAGARWPSAGWRRPRRRLARPHGGGRARPPARARSRRPADPAGRCSRACGRRRTA